MTKEQFLTYALPDVPGVYLFKKGRTVLYVGKATSLHDRVRSYFDNSLIATRGSRIVDMVTQANNLVYETTPTVLEALVREAVLIKKYLPKANVEGKDDKSFLYAVITEEKIPRVLVVRGKDLSEDYLNISKVKSHKNTKVLYSGNQKNSLSKCTLRAIYGPFPSGPQLREGLRLIRRIFPFFDTSRPVAHTNKHHTALIEFNQQIGQYPRKYTSTEYKRTIRNVRLFLSGRGKELRRTLEREMNVAARNERFEDAIRSRRELYALNHIQDVSLIKEEGAPQSGVRIEAYDTAHLAGSNAIGVMVVIEDVLPVKRDYRVFRIRGLKKNDDIGSLKEILSRRLGHPEWQLPKAIVVDGGIAQKRAAETVLKEIGIMIPVAAVVKDKRHQPREVLGVLRAGITETEAVLANAEAHRFSLARHRAARSRQMRS